MCELSGNGATTVARELGGDGAVRGGFALARRERGKVRQRSTNASERGRAVVSRGFVAHVGLTGGAGTGVRPPRGVHGLGRLTTTRAHGAD